MYLVREIFIEKELSTVYNYVLDFSNLFEWDSQVTEAERLTLGPIDKGARFLFSYSLLGVSQELNYQLTEKKDKELLVFETQNNSFSTKDTIKFQKKDQGVLVSYEVDIDLKNKFTELLLKPFMSHIANNVIYKLKMALEGHELWIPLKKKA